ncbi:family 16 glycosylhydrolase [Embleya sp. NBC_00896]|uniref:glycoside hydrolase family 16 protein n=1 Tax=Embleya sp. NBC_00896 TaxID=2975961 RepID=UPI00386843F4|nr:glycoside hydrolase family 16 protein [Embleya sp. NBC_00896]
MRRWTVLLVVVALLAACTTEGRRGGRRLVLREDFTGSAPADGRWVTCYDWNVDGCTNAGNREQQWYRPEQVRVADGQAILTAARRPTRGSDGVLYPWVSGMLSTGRASWSGRPRFTFRYGRVEAELLLPSEPHSFPAFWLMPVSRYTPPELDVVELIGPDGEAEATVHWRGPDGAPRAWTHASPPRDWSARFHRFALDWEPDRVAWSIDGEEVFAVTDRALIPHEPMEVLFTLAMGYPGPVPEHVLGAELRIRSVRVWAR